MGGAYTETGKWEELENNKWEELTPRSASGRSLRLHLGGKCVIHKENVEYC